MKKLTLKNLELEWNTVEKQIVSFIKNYVKNAEADGVVVGLSGGLDSSVTVALCVKALGKENVTALMMPDKEVTPREDIEDAINLSKSLGALYTNIEIHQIYTAYAHSNPIHNEKKKTACGNLRARIRMTILYYYANTQNLLVVGTGNKSEILIGYFTKWGDGAADFRPIKELYKTQVRLLAKHLEIPEHIVTKPSSPRLWKGQLAEREIGIKYHLLDLILFGLVDLEMKSEKIADQLNISSNIINEVVAMIKKTEHKR
ncbi:NAD+ synthase [Candidatus Bathyarchaeota archaeon]|nr:NAD+ synthase [Candidatus Bathyarchaeota archaeon]